MPTFSKLMFPALAAVLASGTAQADEFATQKVKVKIEAVASGLEFPWAIEVLPDGAYIVTERPGRCASSGTASCPKRSRACPKSPCAARAACSMSR
jgi:glucose/arabinose dehydrogenase